MHKNSMLGVTLLEVMLVLAIAAMIIVMSVRYYQTASSAGKVNSALSDMQGIMAGIDSFIAGGGSIDSLSCESAGTADCGTLSPYLPNKKLSSNAWGGATNLKGSSGSYEVTLKGVPNLDCKKLSDQASRNQKIVPKTGASSGTGSGDCVFTIQP